MDPQHLLRLGEELIYDLFGVVFFAFFAVTIVAFRRPLLSYCAASFVVSSVLWVMTTVFNLGYMLPHLIRSICRLERALRVPVDILPGEEEGQVAAAATFLSVSKSMLRGAGPSLSMRSAMISPPIVNEDLPMLPPGVAGGVGAGEMAGIADSEHAAAALSSSGVSGCIAIMLLVCACSALLVAVSVGMVLEANVIEQERERERQLVSTDKETREQDYNDDATASAPLLPGRTRLQQQRVVCCCQGQGPCGRNGAREPAVVLRAAVWMNHYVGIDEMRYTGVYTAQECDTMPRIAGSFFFAIPRACTRLFLGSSRLPSRRGLEEEGLST